MRPLMKPLFTLQPALLLASLAVLHVVPLKAADAPHARLDEKHRAFFKDYCTECHNEKKQKGKLRLDDISFALDSVENADRWQKILNQINSGEMPPEDSKQPEHGAKTEFLDSLSHTLMAARRSLGDSGGKVTMRRLNRREYKNTIRDLLGVDINVRELPADGGAGTFDTVGSSLFMSSDQFEQYLVLGRQALDEHFARMMPVAAPNGSQTFKTHIETEVAANKEMTGLLDRLKKDHDRYVQWTTAVDAEAANPENAVLVKELREHPQVKSNAELFYIHWEKHRDKPSSKQFGYQEAGDARFYGKTQFDRMNRYFTEYLAMPHKDSGSYLLTYTGHELEKITVDAKWPSGTYTLRVRLAALDGAPAERRFIQVGQHGEQITMFTMLGSYQVTGTMARPQTLEIPVNVTSTGKREFVIREKQPADRAALGALWHDTYNKTGTGPKPALWIDWLEIEGPAGAQPAALAAQKAPQSQKLRKDPEQWANKYMPIYAEGYVEKYSRFQKWCAAIDEAAKEPEHAEAVAKLRADPRFKTQPHLFYSGFAKLKDSPQPSQFGFRDVDDAQFARSEYTYHHQYYADYAKLPARDTGTWLMLYSLGRYTGITASEKWPAGKYTLRIRLAASDESPKERRFIEIGTGKADAADFNVLSSHQVTGTLANPQTLEIPVEINASGDRNFAIRDKRPNTREAEYAMFREAWDKTGTGPRPCIWVDFVELEGPVNAMPAQPVAQSFKKHLEPELESNKRVADQHQRLEKRFDDFKRWSAAMDVFAQKPEHQQAVAKLPQGFNGWRRGIAYYQGVAALPGAPSAKDFGFLDMSSALFDGADTFRNDHPYLGDYLKLPHKDTGSYLTMFKVNPKEVIRADASWPAGRYTLRIKAAAVQDSPPERRFIEVGHPDPGTRSGPADDPMVISVLKAVQVTGTFASPQVIEIPVELSLTGSREFVLREKRPNNGEASVEIWREHLAKNKTGPKPAIWIDWIELEGPVNAAAPSAPALTQSLKLHIEPEQQANKEVAQAITSAEDQLKRYQQWAAAVDMIAALPENAEVVKEIRGLPVVKARASAFYQEWEKRKPEPSAKTFGFTSADEAEFLRGQYRKAQYARDYLALPNKDSGSYLTTFHLHPMEKIAVDAKWPPGTYTLRARVGALADAPKERHFLQVGLKDPKNQNASPTTFSLLSTHQITGTVENPQIIEIPVTVNLGDNRIFALREKADIKSANYEVWIQTLEKTGTGPKPALWIDWLEIEGPVSANATSAPALVKTIKERREVELHANAMVGGTYNGYFKGGYEAAKKFMETKQPQKGIPDEQEAKFRIRGFEQNGPTFERYLNDPLTKTGSYLTIYNVHTEEVITLPPDQPSGWLKTKHEVEKAEPGEYKLRFRIGAVKGAPKERHFVALGSRMKPEEREDFTLMQTYQISGTTDAPQVIEVPVSITANGPRTFVLREKRDVKLDHELFTTAQKETGFGPPSALWIDWVEWEGPLAPQATIAKVEHIEPEKRRAEVERGHLRFKYLNEQYAKWKAAGGDEKRLKEFDFTDKSHAEFAKVVWDSNNRWFQQYLDRPLSKTGLFLDNTVQETCEYAIDMPADLASGDYVMRVKIGRVPDMPSERAFLTFVEASPIDKDDRTFLANKQITATLDKPEIIELPFKILPGGPRKFVLFEKRPLKKEGISLPGRTRAITDPKQRDPVLWIDWIEYEGPLQKTDDRRSVEPVLFANTVGAKEHDHARDIIAKFATRGFRDKQPAPAYLDKLTTLFDMRRKAGDAFDVAIREPLSAVLASPGFLYLSEPGDEKKPRALTPLELATRLSYFLWSAPPDEPLLAHARNGDLVKPDVLAGEVDRMIASPKADEFVSGFVHQWLGMDRLDFFQFDTKQFRDFDESAKAAARREVYETFAHLLRSNGSLAKLLKSDEIHVNGLLATYYGIEGISGDEFQKVKLPKDSPRGGLLGMAAILAMGSNGERTSPVERGAWALRKLLHTPPPPAPPNVPQITRLENKLLTTRERLLAHQEEPQCLQCHRKIDPIGFGLENFNAAGKWRIEETYEKRGVGKKTWPIDASSSFYNGPAFQDYFQLRDLIAAKSEDFARGFTEALIEYALGRPFGFADEDLAQDIVKHAKAKDFAIREVIIALATSREFGRK